MSQRAAERPLRTYVFSDVVGSTTLWELQRDEMERDLARHDAIMASSITLHGGEVWKKSGDAFYAVFENPRAAFAAARAAQEGLQAESWSVAGGLRIRMAMHTGESEYRDNDYFGPAVNRTARLLGLADAGHILLSDTTANLIRESVDAGVRLHDHGTHELKGFSSATRVFQAVYPSALGDVRPLVAAPHASPSNLPPSLPPLIGRGSTIARLVERATGEPLITIVGLGGMGKSVLAAHVAHAARADFPDGTWLVDLAPVTDPALVATEIASTLGGDRDRALLVLDNCELLVSAVAKAVIELQRARPNLRVIATSREPLGVPREFVWRLDPLPVDDGITLLGERIRTRNQHFAFDDGSAAGARTIVERLDGIPLAVELAAARCASLSIAEVAKRIDDRFRLLKSNDRSGRRTLREIVAWSFEGLADGERMFLRRLAVFPGTWTIDAAEAICCDDPLDPDDAMDVLADLVDKSLVQTSSDQTRYRFFQTIRAYARELETDDPLDDAGLGLAHAAYFRDLVLAYDDADLTGRQSALARFDLEHENIRAALQTFLDRPGDDDTALILAARLHGLWVERGYPQEGRIFLTRALERSAIAPDDSRRLRARLTRASLNNLLGEYDAARIEGEAVLGLARASGEVATIADALNAIAVSAMHRGDAVTAQTLYGEARAACADGAYPAGEARALYNLGAVAANRGDAAGALALYEASLRCFRALRDRWRIGWVLGGLARLAFEARDLDRARTAAAEALDLRRSVGDRRGVLEMLVLGAEVALAAGDRTAASVALRSVYDDAWAPTLVTETAMALTTTIRWLQAEGQSRLGAQVFGFREAFTATHGSRLASLDVAGLAGLEAHLRADLGDAGFEGERVAGDLREIDAIVRIVRGALGYTFGPC